MRANTPMPAHGEVLLTSSDGIVFLTPRAVAAQARVLLPALEAAGPDPGARAAAASTPPAVTIPLPGVGARPLAALLDYCAAAAALEAELGACRKQHAAADAARTTPAAAGTRKQVAAVDAARTTRAAAAAHGAWAAAWATSLPPPDLFPLAAAASYLDVPGLLDLLVTVTLPGRLGGGRAPAALRADFGLPDDLSAAEVIALRADCAGALDPPGW